MAIPQVQEVLKIISMGRNRFLYGLERVPDDRLNWSPGGAASTPLQLAGKTAVFLSFVSHVLQTRTPPNFDAPRPEPPNTREEANAVVNAAFTQLRKVVSEFTEGDLRQTAPAPWGDTPIGALLLWISGLILYHQGQLNYLQLTYGDEDPNIPPNWGREES
jgi:hypothetical protein